MKFFIKRYLRNLIKIYLVLFLTVTIILSGCSEKNEFTDNSENNENKNNMLNEVVTLFSYYLTPERTELINNLMLELGFNIQFGNTDFDINETELSNIGDFIKEKIGEDKNIAFFASLFSWEQTQTIEKLMAAGYILEISDLYKKYAPNYYIQTFGDEAFCSYFYSGKNKNRDGNKSIVLSDNEEEIYSIPVGEGTSASNSRMAVLIKKDIMDVYSEDIKNIDDYEALLIWIKTNKKEYKPGLFSIKTTGFEYNPIKLMMEEQAYVLSDFMLDSYSYPGSVLYIDSNELIDINDESKINIIQASELPLFLQYMLKYREWADEGLMEYKDIKFFSDKIPKGLEVNSYGTIVVNTFDYLAESCVDISADISLFDIHDYDIYLLNDKNCPSVKLDEAIRFTDQIFFGKNTKNAYEILMFIERLYEYKNDYQSIMYGIEDFNYKKDENGQITIIEPFHNAYIYDTLLSFKKINMDLFPTYYPDNWNNFYKEDLEETNKIPSFRMLFNNIDISNSYDQYSNNKSNELNYDYKAYYASFDLYDKFFEDLLIKKEPNPEQIIQEFIRELSNNEAIKDNIEIHKGFINNELLPKLK